MNEELKVLNYEFTMMIYLSISVGGVLYPAICLFLLPLPDDVPNPSTWEWFGIVGVIMIILSVLWYIPKRRKIIKENKRL
jgi:hypothetical protein